MTINSRSEHTALNNQPTNQPTNQPLTRLFATFEMPTPPSTELATVVAAMMRTAGVDGKGDVPFPKFMTHFKLAD